MQRTIADVFAAATALALSAEERAAVRGDLRTFLRGERQEQGDAAAFAALRGLRLEVAEKESVRASLEARVRRPSRVTPPSVRGLGDRAAEILFQLSFRRLPLVAACAFVFVGAGAAAAAASTSALPGDFLYAYKITVAENPFLRLRFADTARAEWEESLAARRLDEAGALMAAGRLTDDIRATLAARLDVHARRAVAYRERSGGSAAAFDEELRKREAGMRALYGDRDESEVQVRVLLERVAAAKERVTETAAASSAPLAPEDAMARAREQIDGGHRRLEQVRIDLNAADSAVPEDIRADALSRATTATNLLAQAEAKYAAKAWGDALSLATKANLTLQESKLLIRAGDELQQAPTP